MSYGQLTGYTEGNLEAWGYAITTNMPKAWNYFIKTIDPIIYATFIELLGESNKFQKVSADLTLNLDQTIPSSYGITIVYFVPAFAGFAGDPEAITHDEQYILSKLPTDAALMPETKIDVDSGEVTIKVRIPITY